MNANIENIAASWGFEVSSEVGDGNCLFTAVATQISNSVFDSNDKMMV